MLIGTLLTWSIPVGFLLATGRRQQARALARVTPDCLVLGGKLMADRRVTRRSKLLLAGLLGYISSPIDLIPDFIPVVGRLDDALIAALVFRRIIRSNGPEILQEHWPGPEQSLRTILRLAGVRPDSNAPDKRTLPRPAQTSARKRVRAQASP